MRRRAPEWSALSEVAGIAHEWLGSHAGAQAFSLSDSCRGQAIALQARSYVLDRALLSIVLLYSRQASS